MLQGKITYSRLFGENKLVLMGGREGKKGHKIGWEEWSEGGLIYSNHV